MIFEEKMHEFKIVLQYLISNVFSPIENTWTSLELPLPYIRNRYIQSNAELDSQIIIHYKNPSSNEEIKVIVNRYCDSYLFTCEFNNAQHLEPIIKSIGKIKWQGDQNNVDGIIPTIPEVIKKVHSIQAAATWYERWGYRYAENGTLREGNDNIRSYVVSELIRNRLQLANLGLIEYLVAELGAKLLDFDTVKRYTTRENGWEREITKEEHIELVKLLWGDLSSSNVPNLPTALLSYVSSAWPNSSTVSKNDLDEELDGAFEILCECPDCIGKNIAVLNDRLIFLEKTPGRKDRVALKETIDSLESPDKAFGTFSTVYANTDGTLSACEKETFHKIRTVYENLRRRENELLESAEFSNRTFSSIVLITLALSSVFGAVIGFLSYGLEGIIWTSAFPAIVATILAFVVVSKDGSGQYHTTARLASLDNMSNDFWFVWVIIILIPYFLSGGIEVIKSAVITYVAIWMVLASSFWYMIRHEKAIFDRSKKPKLIFSMGLGLAIITSIGGDIYGITEVYVGDFRLILTFPEICTVFSLLISILILHANSYWFSRYGEIYDNMGNLFGRWSLQGKRIYMENRGSKSVKKALKKMQFKPDGNKWKRDGWEVEFMESTQSDE